MAALTLISLDPPGRSAARCSRPPVLAAQARSRSGTHASTSSKSTSRMQRSLLPDEPPDIAGIEIGSVYESSSRLDVGGDVFDYMPDGRLAVVVGDVTGGDRRRRRHGDDEVRLPVARPRASRAVELMRIANQVVLDEVEEGKFVTMLYLTVDPATGEVAARAPVIGAAGRAAGRLEELEHAGSRSASRQISSTPRPGRRWSPARRCLDRVGSPASTARALREVRLDRLLGEQRALRAQQLARAVVEDSRRSPAAGSRTTRPWSSSRRRGLSFQAARHGRLRRRRRDAGDGDRCVAAPRRQELHDRLGERDRADARVALGRLLARRPARRPVPTRGARPDRRRCGLSRRVRDARRRPILDLSVEGLDRVSAGAAIGSFFGVLILFVPPVTLMGMVAPFAIRLAIQDIESVGTVAGRLYAVSTIGSLLGVPRRARRHDRDSARCLRRRR